MRLSARQGFRRNVTSKPENSCSASDIPLLLPLNIGTKFSELRTKTDSVASGIGPSQSPHPCRNGAEAIQRLIGRTRADDRKPCGARFRVHAIGLHYRR